MRQKFIGGNWKMNGNMSSCVALLSAVNAAIGDVDAIDIVVFPPDVYLQSMGNLLVNSTIVLGGQNHCDHEVGAYTGETAPGMLQDMGCGYVLLGHSERRHVFGETNKMVGRKFALAIQHDIVPVLCVGETEMQRDVGETDAVVREQLNAVIHEVGINNMAGCVIAYEPVWAIGTGRVATTDQVQEIHAMIRAHLATYDATIANNMTIVYGGSLKPANAAEIFALPDVDGGLVGGASLVAEDFIALAKQLVALG